MRRSALGVAGTEILLGTLPMCNVPQMVKESGLFIFCSSPRPAGCPFWAEEKKNALLQTDTASYLPA